MYLVHDNVANYHVLTFDPSSKEYESFVAEIAQLELPPGVESLSDPNLHRWRDGSDRPAPVLGLHRGDENSYKVFQCECDCRKEGYEILGTSFGYADTLSDYEKTSGRTLKKKSP